MNNIRHTSHRSKTNQARATTTLDTRDTCRRQTKQKQEQH